jgi:hypothetical protein
MGWGLSFPNEGQPPAAPMTAEKLRELGGAYWDEDGGKVLYLTFDAGYENGFTEEILDVLQELQVPAAFFLTGDYLSREPDLVRRMTAEGHIVGNHTMTHPDMTAVDGETFRSELQGLEEAYFDIMYGQGISKWGELVDMAVQMDIVQKSGSWFSMGDERIGQGSNSVKEYLMNNPEIAEQVEAQVRENLMKMNAVAPKAAAKAADKAVAVSADDFDDED